MMLSRLLEALDVLAEQVIQVELDSSFKPITVTVNPNKSDCKRLLKKAKAFELRGLVDMDKDVLYVWDAFDANHMDIADNLGISMYNEVVITPLISRDRAREICMDHSAKTAFQGDDYILFTRDIPNLNMFYSIEKIFSGDKNVARSRF